MSAGMSPKVAAFQKGQLLKIFIALLLESYQNKTYNIYMGIQSCKSAHTQNVNFSEAFVAANIYRFNRQIVWEALPEFYITN